MAFSSGCEGNYKTWGRMIAASPVSLMPACTMLLSNLAAIAAAISGL